jgi:hypothetical protein
VSELGIDLYDVSNCEDLYYLSEDGTGWGKASNDDGGKQDHPGAVASSFHGFGVPQGSVDGFTSGIGHVPFARSVCTRTYTELDESYILTT